MENKKELLKDAIMNNLHNYATNEMNGVNLISEQDFADVVHDIMIDIDNFILFTVTKNELRPNTY